MDALPFQIGVHVSDIDNAMQEITAGLGLSWTDIRDMTVGEWNIRVAFARQGPPFIELVQGPPGSPWHVASGSSIDHLGYWTSEYERERERLNSIDLPELRGGAGRVHFHLPAAGFRLELFDDEGKDAFYKAWGLDTGKGLGHGTAPATEGFPRGH